MQHIRISAHNIVCMAWLEQLVALITCSLLTYWYAQILVSTHLFVVMSAIFVSPIIFLTRWVRYRVWVRDRDGK